jgi:aspartate/methionine/tyrosine aminotransferase
VKPFSRRAPGGGKSNKLARALAARRAAGGEILDLTVSNPTEQGLAWPRGVIEAALAAVDSSIYRAEPFGLLEARVAICNDLAMRGIRTSPDRIVLTASTSEAYGYLMKLLCDPGDRIAVPVPGYPLVETIAGLESVAIEPFRFDFDGRWRIDETSLREAASPGSRTRTVALVHPSNPTGAFVSNEDLALVKSLGLPIVSDEVFADYAWIDDASHTSSLIARGSDTLVFRLDGLSKSATLPQLKLAWTVVDGPDHLVRDALGRIEHIADAYLSPSIPVQLALPALLVAAPAMREKVHARCRANLQTIREITANTSVTALPVEGGWNAVLRLPAIHDDETWSLFLLEKAGVLTHPGYLYDFPDSAAFLVVSLLTNPTTLNDALPRFQHLVGNELRA